jgi:plasmid replication initiation protein
MVKESKLVKKGNQLIESKYKLSLTESKILAYLISQIQPRDVDLKEYEMSVQLLSEMCNLPKSKVYSTIKDVVDKMQSRIVKIYSDDGGWVNFNFFSVSSWVPAKEKFTFEIHKKLKPFLIDLKSNYTQYSLVYALRFSSSYSNRIYELCLKRLKETKRNHISFELTVDLFKEFLGIPDKYKQFSSLRQRVIDMAVPEINKITDIRVRISPIKKSRAVHSLLFEVETSEDNFPNAVKELIKLKVRADMALQLYEEHGEEVILEKVKKWFYYLTTREMPDGTSMRNPAGFIVDKIREGQQTSIDDEYARQEEKRTLAEIQEEERELKQKVSPPPVSATKKFSELADKATKANSK